MREAANARHEGSGDILLAVAQLIVVSSVAKTQLRDMGMPETAGALTSMVALVCRVLGVGEEDVGPYLDAVRQDSEDWSA